MFAITVTTWMKISSIATAVAALAALLTTIIAAKGVRVTRMTVRTMREQWERDRSGRAAEQHRRRISLVSTLYNECDAISQTYRDGSQAPLSMDEWKKSRAEVALIDEELAGLMAGLELLVERNNGMNKMNAETIYGPERDRLLARLRSAQPSEVPSLKTEFDDLRERMVKSAKKQYEKALPTVDDALTRLAAICRSLKESDQPGMK